jgi:DNA primase
VPREVLTELKLIVARKEATGYYDYFRNRVMFPIVRPGGRVVGFGARAMGDGEPKYLNSSESPVFSKRRTFYGVDRARDAIRKERQVVVVEGYTDLISLHLARLENSVAVCGTALTPEHAQALRRMTQRAVLMPDGDDAGERASVAAGAILLAAGVDVAIVRLDKGMDPDTAARQAGAEKIAQMVAGAIDYFDFLDYIVRERELTARDREDLTRRVAGGLVQLGDGVRRDVLIGDLARVLKVAPESLQAMARSAGRRPAVPAAETPPPPETTRHDPKRIERERLALRLIMEGTPRALEALDALDADDFCEGTHRKIYNLLDSARGSHIDLRSPDVQRRAEETGLDGVAAEIALISVPPGNVETLLDDTVRRIKQQKIDDELAALREQLKDLPPESDEAVALAEHCRLLQLARDQL